MAICQNLTLKIYLPKTYQNSVVGAPYHCHKLMLHSSILVEPSYVMMNDDLFKPVMEQSWKKERQQEALTHTGS